MSEIFIGLNSLRYLKSLVIKHNELGDKSLDPIMNLIDKQFPDNLEVLRIISCKMNALTPTMICQKLSSRCTLRKLSLV